ncbi:MAG: glycosyltransferase family 4 protein [Clostridiales bacterium]|jgi:glycosyltransferase involved in cell wall biosynthesis|nr:glycosyltransferase family 4 protein [Clostridiales bacterium]
MKVLLVNSYYYPEMVGGTEYFVKRLAEALVSTGNSVSVLCLGNGNSVETINGVKVFRYKPALGRYVDFANERMLIRNMICKLVNRIYNPFDLSKLFHILETIKPDVVHSNGLMDISASLWQICKKLNISILHTYHDYNFLCPRGTLISKRTNEICTGPNLLCRLYRCYNRELSRRIDIVTAPSNFVLSAFQKERYLPVNNGYVVSNAINIDMDYTECLIERRSEKIMDKDYLTFVFLGQLGAHKGIKWLLDSFAEVNNSKIVLRIAGKGKLSGLVSEFTKKDSRIIYEGYLSETQVAELLKECDVLIAPSIWEEPFGLIVIEAYKYGLPVIATNRGAFPEIVINEKTGTIIDAGSLSSLRDCIVRYSDDRRIVHGMLTNIASHLKSFSLDEQTSKYIELYKYLLSKELPGRC